MPPYIRKNDRKHVLLRRRVRRWRERKLLEEEARKQAEKQAGDGPDGPSMSDIEHSLCE